MVGRSLGHGRAPEESGPRSGRGVGRPEGAGLERAGAAPDCGAVGAVVDEAPRGDVAEAAGAAGPGAVGALLPFAGPLVPRPPELLPVGPRLVGPPAAGPLPDEPPDDPPPGPKLGAPPSAVASPSPAEPELELPRTRRISVLVDPVPAARREAAFPERIR